MLDEDPELGEWDLRRAPRLEFVNGRVQVIPITGPVMKISFPDASNYRRVAASSWSTIGSRFDPALPTILSPSCHDTSSSQPDGCGAGAPW